MSYQKSNKILAIIYKVYILYAKMTNIKNKNRREKKMKTKKCLIFLAIILASICLFSFSNRVNAVTISDDGKYSLLLTVNDYDAGFDGEYAKLVRFNVTEGEKTVKLSELTKGIVPFNGKTEFLHWEMAENVKASEELAIADFTGNGTFWTSTGEEINN